MYVINLYIKPFPVFRQLKYGNKKRVAKEVIENENTQ
jgi:hypothetical protein